MGTSPSILVVEDEAVIAQDLKLTLEGLGFQVPEVVSTGEAAIRAVAEHTPDLVLMDVMLRGPMDGVEATEHIRETSEVPVVFLTAFGDREIFERVKPVRSHGFLLKPFQGRDLYNAIEVALYKSGLDGEAEQRERVLDATVRGIADGVIAVDGRGRILFMNPGAATILGVGAEASVGRTLHEVFVSTPEIEPASAEVESSGVAELRSVKMGGGARPEFPVEYTHTHIQTDDPEEVASVVVFRDTSLKKKVEETAALRRSEEKYRQLYETMAQGVVYQGSDGSILSANPAAERILGMSLDQMRGVTSMDPRWRAIHEDGTPFSGEDHPSMVALKSSRPVMDVVMGVFHPSLDAYKWITINAIPNFKPGETTPYQVYTTFVDITARKEAEAQLLHEATYDSLTGLANRSLFIDRLRHVIVRSKRRPQSLYAVLFLDLDRFKNINDSLGHQCGDELLIECAKRLSRCLRGEDTAARLGGDEFVILLEEVSGLGEATRVADRIQAELAPAITLEPREVFVTASIGIVVRSEAHETAEGILRDADLAMYRAKEKGRARWELFDASMHERVLARQVLETDLHHVLRLSQLTLCFQPIVDIDSGRPRCFEALPRWSHPELGKLFPGEFLAVAREIGLLSSIERWVLRQACRQLRAWKDAAQVDADVTISVNVSVDLLTSPALISELEAILEETGMEADAVKLEITGAAITSHTKEIDTTLGTLRELGVGLHVDDFGTGLSSVDTLLRLSFEKIKVSQSLISTLSGRVGGEMMQTVIEMAHRLGLGTIVKGVESAEQAEYLREIGCQQGQGRFFGEPLSGEAVAEQMRERVGQAP